MLYLESSFDGAHVKKNVLVHFKSALKNRFVTFEGICWREVNKCVHTVLTCVSIGQKCCTEGVITHSEEVVAPGAIPRRFGLQ